MTLKSATALLFLICIISVVGYCPAHSEQTPAFINVRDCGAKGDGVTDDTEAILKAIKQGSEKLLSVHFPRGSYKLTKTLTIERQSLMGNEPGAWSADSGPMPQFLIHHNSGPALVMRDGASVHGINFNYEPRKFEKYPPAILMEGQGLSITNVRLQTCDDGIITAPKAGVGRLNIENVFIISPCGTGVYVTRTYDIPTIRNIEIWNNQNRKPITAFKFGRNDGLRGSHLFAFNVDVGFELEDAPEGGTWAVFTDCGTDATGVAWRADGKAGHTVGITGGYFWNHHQTFLLNNPNVSLRVTGSELQSNGSPVVTSAACHNLLLTGCRLGRAYANPDPPYIDLQAVDSFTMGNCVVTPYGPVMKLGKGIKKAVIHGNIFEESAFPRIVSDERGKDSEIIIEDNAGMTPVKEKKADPVK